MERIKLLCALLVASMVANPPNAAAAPVADVADVTYITLPGFGRLPYAKLYDIVSDPGESVDAFMGRIGIRLREFSDKTGFEACGVVATDGERFGVVVGTNLAHTACANFDAFVPSGMRSTGSTIHSHGGQGQFKMTTADLLFAGIPESARSRHLRGTVYGQELDKFSERDLAGGPGYLATPDGVIHQDGEGSVRKVP